MAKFRRIPYILLLPLLVVAAELRGAERSNSTPAITVPAPSDKARVTAGIALQPRTVARGETITVFIKARIAEGHWIYAFEKSSSKNIVTSIEDFVPRALKPDGPWRAPTPKIQPDKSGTLAGEVLFQRSYIIHASVPPKKHKLRFKLEFQVCNDLVCWPSETIDMETELEIVRPR